MSDRFDTLAGLIDRHFARYQSGPRLVAVMELDAAVERIVAEHGAPRAPRGTVMLTPEQRAEWRVAAEHDAEETRHLSGYYPSARILALLDALDAAEASAAEQVTTALDEVERRLGDVRARSFHNNGHIQQVLRDGIARSEAIVHEVRQSLTEGGIRQCDGSCHEDGRDDCPRCGTLAWDQMCDDCRTYAAQDGEVPS